jgi:hypothetical protein
VDEACGVTDGVPGPGVLLGVGVVLGVNVEVGVPGTGVFVRGAAGVFVRL